MRPDYATDNEEDQSGALTPVAISPIVATLERVGAFRSKAYLYSSERWTLSGYYLFPKTTMSRYAGSSDMVKYSTVRDSIKFSMEDRDKGG